MFATFDLLRAQVTTYAVNVRKVHNRHRPINQLPSELFVEIIKRSLIRSQSRVDRLQELTSVCTLWGEAIASTPMLWSVITAFDSHESISHALSMSRTVPLEVTMWEDDRQARRYPSRKVELLARCADRWKMADLRIIPRSQHLLLHLEASGAPFLEVLKIKIRKIRNQILTTHFLFGGHADRLRILHITGFRVPHDADFMRHLHDLHLGDTYLTPSELETILRNNPGLVSLSIEGVIPPVASDLTSANLPLHHKALRTLDFPGSNHSPAPYVLPYLEVPSYDKMTVALDEHPPSGLLTRLSRETLLHVIRHVRLSRIPVEQVVWVVGGDDFAFELSELRSAYRVHCWLPTTSAASVRWAEAAVNMLSPAIQSADYTLETHVASDDVTLNSDQVLTFGLLPRVRTIHNRFFAPHDLTKAMSHAVETGGGPRWLYPEVETLIFELFHPTDLELLSDMIKSRYADRSVEVGSAPSGPHHPKPFKRIQLPDLDWTKGSEGLMELESMTGLSAHAQPDMLILR